jgi:hypothetical protein
MGSDSLFMYFYIKPDDLQYITFVSIDVAVSQ